MLHIQDMKLSEISFHLFELSELLEKCKAKIANLTALLSGLTQPPNGRWDPLLSEGNTQDQQLAEFLDPSMWCSNWNIEEYPVEPSIGDFSPKPDGDEG